MRVLSRVLPTLVLAWSCAGTLRAETGTDPAARPTERAHHIFFAHRVMPRLFFREPARLLDSLAERRAELLRLMWVDLGEQFFSTAQVAPDGIDVVVPAITGARIVIMVFPAPVAPAEAYFAALVQLPDGTLRYFTLERAVDPQGGEAPETVLGGWDQAGAHLNFGAGPRPTPEDFTAAVRRLLAAEASLPDADPPRGSAAHVPVPGVPMDSPSPWLASG